MPHNLSVPLFAKGQSKAKQKKQTKPLVGSYQSLNVTHFIIEITEWCEDTGQDNEV